MCSKAIDNIRPHIDRVLSGLSERLVSIIILSEQERQRELNVLNSRIVSEARDLLNEFVNELTNKAMLSDIFQSSEMKNAFYDLNLDVEILNRYSFELSPISLDPPSQHMYLPYIASIGSVGLGVVLSSALSSSTMIILPISIIIGAALFIILRSIQTKWNQESTKKIADEYLTETKKQLLVWFENIESFFDSRIAMLNKG